MNILIGAGLLALAIIFLLAIYLWRKTKPFRDQKKVNQVRPDPRAGVPTRSRQRP